MSVGHSSALGGNGYAVSGSRERSRIKLIRRRMIVASARVGLHRFPGEVIAFDEHFVDFVNGFPAVAGRTARPERREEFEVRGCLPPLIPARQTFGLARQIRKG